MNALFALTVANIKSYVRDRAALFWTLAFPLIFIFMFGFIFQGGGGEGLTFGWVDDDTSPESEQLHTAFTALRSNELVELTEAEARAQMQDGQVDAVIVVPDGYGEAITAGTAGSATAPASITVITDPSRSELAGSVYQAVGAVLGIVNLGGRPPLVVPDPQTIQTENLNFISYFVPSMLGLSVMQVGIFAAIPLVADREKLILKRLAATPLRRWQLVGSNVLMRLLIAMVQSVIIVAVGVVFFGVEVTGSLAAVAFFVILGARGVPRPRLRGRFLRRHRGCRQRHDQRHPVPDDVPVGNVLPDRPDAGRAAEHRPDHPAHLPLGRAPPGDGERGGVRPAVRVRRGAAGLAGRVLRDRGGEVPLAVALPELRSYQRSQWTRSSSGRRPPALSGRWRSAGSAG